MAGLDPASFGLWDQCASCRAIAFASSRKSTALFNLFLPLRNHQNIFNDIIYSVKPQICIKYCLQQLTIQLIPLDNLFVLYSAVLSSNSSMLTNNPRDNTQNGKLILCLVSLTVQKQLNYIFGKLDDILHQVVDLLKRTSHWLLLLCYIYFVRIDT